jgi:hypothetical protein
MTSIGTEKISRGYASRLSLFSPLPVFTGNTGVPPGPHSSDGHSRFPSLSPYRPSFSNLSRHRAVGLDSLRAVALPPIVGFTIIAAEPWSPTPLQITAMIGGFAAFIALLLFWNRYDNKKEREAVEHIKKGGEPRNFREYQVKLRRAFLRNVAEDLKEIKVTPHILTCPHGIIRYQPKIPKSLRFFSIFVKQEDLKEEYEKVDERILKLLEADLSLVRDQRTVCTELQA